MQSLDEYIVIWAHLLSQRDYMPDGGFIITASPDVYGCPRSRYCSSLSKIYSARGNGSREEARSNVPPESVLRIANTRRAPWILAQVLPYSLA